MITFVKKILRGFKAFLKKIHYSIPAFVRNIYWPVIDRSLYFLEKQFNALFPLVVLFEGLERTSQAPLAFAYAGDVHKMYHYWDHMMLADGFQKRVLGRRFYATVFAEIKKNIPTCSFLMMEQSRLTSPWLGRKNSFSIPLWIQMELGMSAPMDKLFSRQRADIERLIRKNRLSFHITKDRQAFIDFYHTMFLPYVKFRYTDTAAITPYDVFVKTIPGSEMILIKQDEKTIAGASVEFKNGKPMLRRVGVAHANQEYVRMGAIGAIYYFLAQELKKRGYRVIDVGGTRPLLSDGLTRYKLSLGTKLCRNNSKHSSVRLMVLQDTQGSKSFLTQNPFFFKNKQGKICRAVFVENKGDLSTKKLDKILSASDCKGISETRVFVFGNKNLSDGSILAQREPVSIHSSEEVITN